MREVFTIALCVFVGIVDPVIYGTAKHPDRCKWWAYLPGGGVAARVIYGPDVQ